MADVGRHSGGGGGRVGRGTVGEGGGGVFKTNSHVKQFQTIPQSLTDNHTYNFNREKNRSEAGGRGGLATIFDRCLFQMTS